MEPKKQENVDKTLTETIDDVQKSRAELQLQCMMQRMEQMELDIQAMEAELGAKTKLSKFGFSRCILINPNDY